MKAGVSPPRPCPLFRTIPGEIPWMIAYSGSLWCGGQYENPGEKFTGDPCSYPGKNRANPVRGLAIMIRVHMQIKKMHCWCI